jgi:hypothetical protein
MEVITAAWADQPVPSNNIRTRVHFVVYAALDETKLKSALEKLIGVHWRKLGGRLVPNSQTGRLEYHIPRVFKSGYELFKWSSKTIGRNVNVPQPTRSQENITLHDSVETLIRPFTPRDWPLERKFETPDAPLLWVHLCYCTDATVVGINLPHAVSDQLGLATIVKAWLGLVDGQEPGPLLSVNEDDVLSANEREMAQRKRIGQLRLMTNLERFRQMWGLLSELALEWRDDVHSVFIPHSLVRKLRDKCSAQAKSKYGYSLTLSNGDVVAAVLMKVYESPPFVRIDRIQN